MTEASSRQFRLTENPNDFEQIVDCGDDLRRLHHTMGMSFFKILYKYRVGAQRLYEVFNRFDVHREEPYRWQNDVDTLQAVSDNEDEVLFASLLKNQITERDVKAVIEGHGIKTYDENFDDIQYKQKQPLREALQSSNTVTEAAEKLEASSASMLSHWVEIYFDCKPSELLEPESDETSDAVGISEDLKELVDLDALAEGADADVELEVSGQKLVATVTAESSGVLSFEREKSVDILSL